MRATVVLHLESNAEQALRCLASLAALPEDPEHEVIVIDDATAGLEDLLARLDGEVAVLRSESRGGLGRSLALAGERARGEAVVVLRGMPEVGEGWLAPLVEALADPGVCAAASLTAGAAAQHPATAHAVAVRRDDLAACGIPDVPDDAALAAICIELGAGGGRTVSVPASVVTPAARTGGARRPPGDGPEVSIVIPTLDVTCDRVRRSAGSVQRATDAPHEIILVDNGAPPQGFTAPVNAGIRAARGRYVVVMNDDVEALPGWWGPLRETLDAGALVAFPVTLGESMRRDFAAWCFALSRESLGRVSHAEGELFDEAFTVWFQDTDLLTRIAGLGSAPVCVESSRIRHGHSETVDTADPALRAWIDRQIAEDERRFRAKWPGVDLVPARFESGAAA